MGERPELLKAQEVADRLRVSVQSVYRWTRSEDGNPPVLPAVMIGKVFRFRSADVDALVSAGLPDQAAS